MSGNTMKDISSTSVVLVSDITGGGAGFDSERLYRGLCDSGACSLWFALPGQCDMMLALLRRILFRFTHSERIMEFAGNGFNNVAMARRVRKEQCDIINLHNLHCGMSFGLVKRLPSNVPIVWTLHDMWPLTGYCKYSCGCKKFEAGCIGDCPQENLWGLMLNDPHGEWRDRHLFFEKNAWRLRFVSPSRWLAGCARARLPKDIPIEVIPYGVPLKVFRPIGDKLAVRRALGLPLNRDIVLCGSLNINDPRKGTLFLVDALRRLRTRFNIDPCVVVFGLHADKRDIPAEWLCAGLIHDESLLNLYYNAADVFVAPSLADNLPNTLLEATAAGTPCVAFNVGGCSEVVRDGLTGFTARVNDIEDLAACINRTLDMTESQRAEMGSACRQVAEVEYGLGLQAQRYIKVFEDIKSRRNGALMPH